LNQRYKFFRIW